MRSCFTIVLVLLLNADALEKSSVAPCTLRKCLNGGSCTVIDNHSTTCVCTSRFSGEFCEYRNPCESNPCRNGGTCEIFFDSGVCSCPTGYEGGFCEIKKTQLGGSLVNLDDYGGGGGLRSDGLSTFLKKVKKTTVQDGVRSDPCYVPGGGFVLRCLNGGTCVPLEVKVRQNETSNGNRRQYECECSPKFAGPFCEFGNLCFSNPCRNGGSCEVHEDSAVCVCPKGYEGVFCEEIGTGSHSHRSSTGTGEMGHKTVNTIKRTGEIKGRSFSNKHSEMSSSSSNICGHFLRQNGSDPCSLRGTCIPINETMYRCDCYEKYSGDVCQFRNPCHEFKCHNGGICEVFEASGICSCAEGYVGTFCEEEIFLKEVTDAPKPLHDANPNNGMCTLKTLGGPQCLNGGRCSHLKGSPSKNYECICPDRFTGRWCEFSNACKSSPCLNGGSCEPFEDSGICTCPVGFKGTFCEEIDDTPKSRMERLGRVFPLLRKEIKERLRKPDDEISKEKKRFYRGKEVNLKKFDHCDNSENDSEKPICLNGGRCIILDEETYGCECTLAYAGPVCQFEDVCASAPCINGGSCESLESSGVCICPPEWTGKFCENEVIDVQRQNEKQDTSQEKSNKPREIFRKSGNLLSTDEDDEEEDDQPYPLEPSSSILNHLYKSKIPPKRPYPDFLELQPKEYYQERKHHVVRIPGFEDIDSRMIRIADDGTIYVRRPKPKKVDKGISPDLDLDLSSRHPESSSDPKKDHIVDASIVKVMPNGEIFIKMKIPRHRHFKSRQH